MHEYLCSLLCLSIVSCNLLKIKFHYRIYNGKQVIIQSKNTLYPTIHIYSYHFHVILKC
ncbi:protein of unknown function [Shewanella benthica]|uniref:Uncharacterized protein n=1 Tax=Shewanella benthica TaxID=43661 RepID=A0A330M3E8_9GAMM|nr:protein of unknown function [Shewanella benthica]